VPERNPTRPILSRFRSEYLQVAMGMALVVFFSFVLLWYEQIFITETLVRSLLQNGVGYQAVWTFQGPAILMELSDGTTFSIVITLWRSGIVSIVIFGFVFVTLTFPLHGPFLSKVVWLGFGSLVGLVWNLVRLALIIVIVGCFGISAYRVVDFVTGPAFDFIWMVPAWSIGLSMLACSRHREKQKAEA